MKIYPVILQVVILITLAPLVSGFIRKLKNNLRMRKGAGILQPYYNLVKLFSKDEVISENASWIFRVTPLIVLGSTIAALLLVPIAPGGYSLDRMGDILTVIFILALGRFFLALAGIDAGSAFGGMGSSREMFISSIAEPTAILAVFAVAMNAGSTSLTAITGTGIIYLSGIIAGMALFIVTIAETSRIPVDNQETHLELTMVHEAMVLEYSGKGLALIELSSHIKQIIFFSILANAAVPIAAGGIFLYAAKIAVIAVFVALLEISVAKMRLFRVVDLLSFSIILSIMAVLLAAIGV